MRKNSVKNILKVSLFSLCLLSAGTASSQSKFKVTPTSRLLLDGATYSTDNVDLTEGFGVRDFRMGLKAYYEQFYFKADASFVNNKVSLKDIYLQYNLDDKSFLRAGHFTVPFGLSSAYGTAQKQFMAEPSSNVYQMGRRVGIMHSVWNDNFWISYGAFADAKTISESTDVSGKQGYTLGERFVYRPICNDGYLLQAGFSMNHVQAEARGVGKERTFTYSAPFLTAVDKTKAVDALIDKARYENKYTVELAGIYKSFALESQYYYSDIKRADSPSYKSNGFYVTAKGLILNRVDYGYNKQSAGLNSPSNKNLELIAGYSVLDLNDKKPGIYGGKMQDISIGLAYYWNKYVTFRTNYSYITVTDKGEKGSPKEKVNAWQIRAQYYF